MDATSRPQCGAVRHSARGTTFDPRSLRTRRRKKRSPRGPVIREHEWERVHGGVKDCRRLNRTARAVVERGQNDRQRDQGHDAQQNFLHQSERDGSVVSERRAIGARRSSRAQPAGQTVLGDWHDGPAIEGDKFDLALYVQAERARRNLINAFGQRAGAVGEKFEH